MRHAHRGLAAAAGLLSAATVLAPASSFVTTTPAVLNGFRSVAALGSRGSGTVASSKAIRRIGSTPTMGGDVFGEMNTLSYVRTD